MTSARVPNLYWACLMQLIQSPLQLLSKLPHESLFLDSATPQTDNAQLNCYFIFWFFFLFTLHTSYMFSFRNHLFHVLYFVLYVIKISPTHNYDT